MLHSRSHEYVRLCCGSLSSQPSLTVCPRCQYRNATCTAQTTCKLLTITRREFEVILRRAFEQDVLSRMAFLATIPIFSRWSTGRLRRLGQAVTSTSLKAGEEVARQGEPVHDILIVQKGALALEVCASLPHVYMCMCVHAR